MLQDCSHHHIATPDVVHLVFEPPLESIHHLLCSEDHTASDRADADEAARNHEALFSQHNSYQVGAKADMQNLGHSHIRQNNQIAAH